MEMIISGRIVDRHKSCVARGLRNKTFPTSIWALPGKVPVVAVVERRNLLSPHIAVWRSNNSTGFRSFMRWRTDCILIVGRSSKRCNVSETSRSAKIMSQHSSNLVVLLLLLLLVTWSTYSMARFYLKKKNREGKPKMIMRGHGSNLLEKNKMDPNYKLYSDAEYIQIQDQVQIH